MVPCGAKAGAPMFVMMYFKTHLQLTINYVPTSCSYSICPSQRAIISTACSSSNYRFNVDVSFLLQIMSLFVSSILLLRTRQHKMISFLAAVCLLFIVNIGNQDIVGVGHRYDINLNEIPNYFTFVYVYLTPSSINKRISFNQQTIVSSIELLLLILTHVHRVLAPKFS